MLDQYTCGSSPRYLRSPATEDLGLRESPLLAQQPLFQVALNPVI